MYVPIVEIGDTRIKNRLEAPPPTQTVLADITGGWGSKIMSYICLSGIKRIHSFKISIFHFIF